MIIEKPNTKWEWQTLGLMFGCYLVWGLSTASTKYLVEYGGEMFVCLMLFCVTAICAAFHSSLQHEVVHGHPTPYKWLNETLIFPSLIMVYPFRRYRELHLKHHVDENLTDPYDDPESYYWPHNEHHKINRVMRALLLVNNTFIGRMAIGAPLGLFGFYRTDFSRIVRNENGVRLAWVLHFAGLIPVILWVVYFCGIPFWQYVLFAVYPGVSWILVRSYAEHQANDQIGGRTAIIETNGFFSLLYLNNNLHIVHHAHPAVAWYDLPNLYRERKQNYLASNGNYLFEGYWQVVCKFAWRAKQPVCHPHLYRHSEIFANDQTVDADNHKR